MRHKNAMRPGLPPGPMLCDRHAARRPGLLRPGPRFCALLLSALTFLGAAHAHALGRLADVTLIDRDTGAVLGAVYYRGEYWVAGRPGARYAIRVYNRRGERLLAVASVDGVNVVTGATASTDQAGYVFNPHESYTISGWRKSDAEVADFVFTDPTSAYATRTGRPANVGIIGIALFRERTPEPLIGEITPPPEPRWPRSAAQSPPPSAASGDAQSGLAANAARAAPPAANALREQSSPSLVPPSLSAPFDDTAMTPQLGTGHGEREYAPVSHTEFVRLQNEPNEVIRIRYDRLEHLVALGIVRRAPPEVPSALDPFPGSPHYVPDPPG